MTNSKGRNWRKIIAAIAIALLFALGFFILGLFIDIQIVLKLNYTPIPFTFILPFVGATIGIMLAWKTTRPKK